MTRFALVLAGLLLIAAAEGGVTVQLQNGRGDYQGTRDVTLSSQYLDGRHNLRGLTERTEAALSVYTVTGAEPYTARALLWFDLSAIPKTAKVLAARLHLTIETWSEGAGLVGRYVATPWDYKHESLGWTHRAGNKKWSKPGLGDADLRGAPFTIDAIQPTGLQPRDVALDPAEVQAWIADPFRNYGVLLDNPKPDAVLRVLSSEHPNVEERPRLSITFEP